MRRTVEQDLAYRALRDVLHRSGELVVDPDLMGGPPPGLLRKVDVVRGTTRVIFCSLDEQILSEMPDDVREQVSKAPNDQSLLLTQCIKEGHVKAWIRCARVLNVEIGRWVYWEVIADMGEIKFDPKGESARAWNDVMVQIQAWADEFCSDPSHTITQEKIKP